MISETVAAAYFKSWRPGDPVRPISVQLEKFSVSRGATVADCLIEAYADISHPNLGEDLDFVIDSVDDDIVALLKRFSCDPLPAEPDPQAYSRFPRRLLAGSVSDTVRLLNYKVSDGHLHSGASLHVDPLLRSLAAARECPLFAAAVPRRQSVASRSAVGAADLLAICRWGLRYIWELSEGVDDTDYDRLDETGLIPAECAAIAAGEYWAGFSDFDDWKVARPGLIKNFADRGQCPPVEALLRDYLFTSEPAPTTRRGFGVGLIWVIWRLATEVASAQGEGLSRFVDRFDAMGAIRDAALSSVRQAQVVEALRSVAPSRDVVGAEFRKSLVTTQRGVARDKIRVALAEHMAGFNEYLDLKGRSMALTMPVTFTRRPGLKAKEPTLLTEFRHAMESAQGLSDVIEHAAELGAMIYAVDVVGPEVGSQNWPFVNALNLVAKRCPDLVRSAHAGESFISRLTGLRKIGEVLEGPSAGVQRIGHALALDAQSAACITRRTVSPVELTDAIFDVSWAARVGIADAGAAQRLIQDMTRDLAGHYGTLSPNDWYEGSGLLLSLEGAAEAGLAYSVGPDDWRVASDDEATGLERILRGRSLAANLLARNLGEKTARRRLTADTARSYSDFASQYEDDLASYLQSRISDGGIVIECCPTSNVVLAGLQGYAEHPVWRFRNYGLTVTVSTDDPIIFGTSIVEEFGRLTPYAPHAELKAIADDCVRVCSGGARRRPREYEAVRLDALSTSG